MFGIIDAISDFMEESGFVCQLEIKTPPRVKREKEVLFVEALPLAIHIYLNRIGIKTLYVHSDSYVNVNAAFWADDNIVPYVHEIRVPPKSGTKREYTEAKLREIIGAATPKIVYPPNLTQGSNDPYAILNLEALRKGRKTNIATMLESAILFCR